MQGRRDVRTAQRRDAFLRMLRDGTNIGDAAKAIGVSRQSMYAWRADDADLAAAWNEAIEHQTEVIESVLFKKAKAGDLLACIFWLKSHKPEIYNRKQVVAVGGDPEAPPIAMDHAHHLGGSNPKVTFYMPSNSRDGPMADDEAGPLIEGAASAVCGPEEPQTLQEGSGAEEPLALRASSGEIDDAA